jgi:hypothetical protein
MRGTGTLESFIGKVHMMSRGNYDEFIPVTDLEFEGLGTARISGKEVALLPSAQRLFANRLRIPLTYLERCPIELQAENLNFWIREEAKGRETLFCRFSEGGLRAVFTDRYTAIDNIEVLYAAIQHGVAPNQEVQFLVDDSLMLVKIPHRERTFGVASKDMIVPGVSLGNSEVGTLAFCLETYFYRLICSNGLIAKTTAVSSRFKHVSRKALDEFPMLLSQAVTESQRGQDQFMISTRTPVQNPQETFTRLNNQFLITKRMAEAVERAWPLEVGEMMFNIINAYTRAAQDMVLEVEESMHLERVGGQILSMLRL